MQKSPKAVEIRKEADLLVSGDREHVNGSEDRNYMEYDQTLVIQILWVFFRETQCQLQWGFLHV